MKMSLHFRNALQEKCLHETIQFLETKRLFDQKVSYLTNIIHPSLSSCMRELRSHMSAVKGPTEVALINGWTSAFPCFGMGINRTTGLHRDTRGLRGGLDIIGVLGTFTMGGDLELPDLNLRVEWRPGCLGAFDGYDFRHKVNSWTGGSRVALISFCRQTTWSGLGLDSTLSRPTASECQARLLSATNQRSVAIEEFLAKAPVELAETHHPKPSQHEDRGEESQMRIAEVLGANGEMERSLAVKTPRDPDLKTENQRKTKKCRVNEESSTPQVCS
jgi:hypothetical protein